jgi:hypothetical protein
MDVAWDTVKRLIDWLLSNAELEYVLEMMESGKSLLDSHRRGQRWEREFRELCERRGLEYKACAPNAQSDCLVNGIRVQCKAHYDLSPADSHDISQMRPVNGVRKYSQSEIDVLALRCCDGLWLFPVSALADKRDVGYVRSSVIPIRYPECRENWQVFDSGYVHVRSGFLNGVEW